MKSAIIGIILRALLKEYESGVCDNISDEEQSKCLEALNSLYDNLSNKQDKVLTIEETRQYLGCTRQTLNNYVNEGKLKPKKHLGGTLEFKLKDLKNFIKQHKQNKK